MKRKLKTYTVWKSPTCITVVEGQDRPKFPNGEIQEDPFSPFVKANGNGKRVVWGRYETEKARNAALEHFKKLTWLKGEWSKREEK